MIFKVVTVCPMDIPSTGSIAQVVYCVPVLEDALEDGTKAANTNVIAQCASDESRTHIGVSEVFGLCQLKVSGPEAAVFDPSRISSWSCITFTAADPPPRNFIEHANDRQRFADRVYYVYYYIVNPYDQIIKTVARLAKTPS